MIYRGIVLLFLILSGFSVHAESPAPEDNRELVSMPPEALAILRQEMLDHQLTLSEIVGLLADNNFSAAAEVAETKMGRSSMGKHRGTEFAPGRHMPTAMRSIGWSMHDAATEFAEVARKEDARESLLSFQKLLNTCVACHQSFRTR